MAVNVNFRGMESDKLDNLVSIAAHLSALWATRNAREEERLADIVIAVNARGIPLYDLSKARELLRRGRKAAEEQLPRIRALLRRSAATRQT